MRGSVCLVHLLWSCIFLRHCIHFSALSVAAKERCHEVSAMHKSFLLDLGFVTSMATHFVTHVKSGLELLWQTFPASCCMAVQPKVRALVTHLYAPSARSFAPTGAQAVGFGENFNDSTHLVRVCETRSLVLY